MDSLAPDADAGISVTADIAAFVAEPSSTAFPARAMQAARHAMLDWTGVTLAGASEPLVDILITDAEASGEKGANPVIGRSALLTPAFAALVNGAASHALDYDDVNTRMMGHPTVAVTPAILACGGDAPGARILDALIVATEVACRLGEMMGIGHYDRGFHNTATIGSVAAAAGASRMRDADHESALRALGLAATQAAGLKSMFGTMAKPLHAGKAAMNGLLAARWGALGLTASAEGIEGSQGFGPVLSDGFQPGPFRPEHTASWGIEANLYKYHAACYLTHSAIEAGNDLREMGATAEDVERLVVRGAPANRGVCDIPKPRTGLEVKFSIRHLVALALCGEDLSRPDGFSDDLARHRDACALTAKAAFEPDPAMNRTEAEVRVTLKSGRELIRHRDVGIPASDLDQQEQRLIEKFRSLATPVVGAAAEELCALILKLDEEPDMTRYWRLATSRP